MEAMNPDSPTVLFAAAVRDAAGVSAAPGAVLVERGQVVAAGDPASLPADRVANARRIDLPDRLVLPAMVNAHAHLDLTAIGPKPYDAAGGFVGWVNMLRSQWPTDAGHAAEWFAQAAAQGARDALAAGVQAVGDISRHHAVARARDAAGLEGVTYIEGLGLGPPFDVDGLREARDGCDGLQPHAPYSAGPAMFAAAAASGRPVSTHLAETLDECAFVARLAGPKLDFVRSIGRWSDDFAAHYGHGLSPVQWMRPHLERAAPDGGWLVAHCNYVDDTDIKLLADTNTSVAYCPLASDYFDHPLPGHPPHRYRDMLAAGVNVALGTDSVVCQPDDEPQPLGILPQMRHLHRRDGTDPAMLLRMATLNGARALRLPDRFATLRAGAPARFVTLPIHADDKTDALLQTLASDAPAEMLDLTERDKL